MSSRRRRGAPLLLDRFVRRGKKRSIERRRFALAAGSCVRRPGSAIRSCGCILSAWSPLEYLLVAAASAAAHSSTSCSTTAQGKDGRPFVPGLIDVERLRAIGTTTHLAGAKGEFAGSSRPQRGPTRGDRGVPDARRSSIHAASRRIERRNR